MFSNSVAQEFEPLDQGTPLAAVDTGIPYDVYVLGAVLLGIGGVLLWLLFRQREPVGAAVATNARIGGPGDARHGPAGQRPV